MEPIEIIAQAISIAAMGFNVLSYQQKSKQGVLLLQIGGASLFALSFLLLGSTIGAILNAISAIRAIVYANRRIFHSEHILWLVFFIAVCLLSYVLNFTVLGVPADARHLALELLPVIGMIATTVSYRMEGAKAVRRLGLISSPSWLIYNIAAFSIGAILCEVFSLFSIVIGMIRFDIKKGEKPSA